MPLEEFTKRAKPQQGLPPPSAGDRYRNYANQLLHVRGVVDDQVVFRRWSRVKGWIYKVEPPWYFEPSEGFTIKAKGRNKAGDKTDAK